MERSKKIRIYVLSILIWISALILALEFGAVSHIEFETILETRLPRALLASTLGAGLAISGAALQALFVNPLCEPYTLGISSGSALGAVLGASLGLDWMFAGLAGSAFLGAIVFAGILYIVSLRPQSTNITLLLTGVTLGFLGNSWVTLWIAMSDGNGVQSALVWLFGDISRARVKGVSYILCGMTILSLLVWAQWRRLDALLLGEEGALALGVDVRWIRRHLIVLTSLIIGFAVSAGGMIGFVGLVVPHFIRRWVGSLHLHLIPLCGIWGAIILTLADVLSRVLIRPYELPIGVVTALFGAPVFLWIMLKRQES